MPIYMKIDGVDGSVTEADHTGWVELNSFQWGVGRGISTPVGSAANREASLPSISEIVVTRQMDKASSNLFDLSVSDATGKAVQIDFVQTATGGSGNIVYLHYELENALISGYSLSSGGNDPSESISINFTKISQKWTDYDAANQNPTPTVKGYDLANAKPF